MKSTLFAIVLTFLAQLAFAAVPPACLLHGVNTQSEPANLKAVCGDGAQTVQQYLGDNCGKFEEDAQKTFIDTCSSAGISVAAYTATATGSSATGTITSAGSTGSASGTGASTQSTAGANIYYRDGMGAMGAAAIALVGAVAAL